MCDSNAVCSNTEGSYVCSCVEGYTGDGKTCTGIGFNVIVWVCVQLQLPNVVQGIVCICRMCELNSLFADLKGFAS